MKLTDIIYSVITDKDILSYYLKIPKSQIEFLLLDRNNRISNPLRIDENPSMGMIEITKGKQKRIKVKDFANNAYTGDVYSIAGIVLQKNSNNPEHFKFICNDIIKNVILNNNDIHTIFSKNTRRERKKKTGEMLLTFTYKEWDNHALRFWYNITNNKGFTKKLYEFLLIEKVYIPEKIYYDENLLIYDYKHSDRAYVYVYNITPTNVTCKIYFPDRIKGNSIFKSRFITNDKTLYRGLNTNVDTAKDMIMTKSFKDAIFIKTVFTTLSSFSSPTGLSMKHIQEVSIPNVYYVQGESNFIPDKDMQAFETKYDHLFWLMDYDLTGITNTYFHTLISTKVIPLFIKPNEIYLQPNDFTAIINRFNNEANITIDANNIRMFMKSFKVRRYYKFSKDFTDLLQRKGLNQIYKLINFLRHGYSI